MVGNQMMIIAVIAFVVGIVAGAGALILFFGS